MTFLRCRLRHPAAALALVALAAAGCSTFNRDWQRARAAESPELAGAWSGRWLSAHNGHQGSLKAILRPVAEGKYEARFRSSFWKVFKAEHALMLDTAPSSEGWQVSGKANLGRWLFWDVGHYGCEGMATTNAMDCRYTSRFDHGTFTLGRPGPRRAAER